MSSSGKAGASKRLVLGASVAVSWCFEDQGTSTTKWILDRMAEGSEAVVPPLWPFEVANALLQAQRYKKLTPAQAAVFLEQLESFNLVVEAIPLSRVFGRVFTEASQWNLTVYDAAYLELALHHGLPLATLDSRLQDAAKELGVPMVHSGASPFKR